MQKFIFKYAGKTMECLSECHRHRIFKLCTAHLHYVRKIIAAPAEFSSQFLQMGYESQMAGIHSQMNCGRIGIICRLGAVYMVVRGTVFIFAGLMPHMHQGNVGNHLICIHVRTSTCATLNHIYRELFVVFAVKDILACCGYGLVLFICK